MSQNRFKLASQVAQPNLVHRATFTERLFKFGFRDAAILFFGGLALFVFGALIWWIGAQWLTDWIDTLATRADRKAGWLGLPLQAILTVIELAFMLKIKDNPRLIFALAFFVAIDAGTNTAGTLNFIMEFISYGKLPVFNPIILMALPTIPLVAALTYGPERLVTWGAEMVVEGWQEIRLVFAAARLSLEKDQEEEEKKSRTRQSQPGQPSAGGGKGWTIIQGKGDK